MARPRGAAERLSDGRVMCSRCLCFFWPCELHRDDGGAAGQECRGCARVEHELRYQCASALRRQFELAVGHGREGELVMVVVHAPGVRLRVKGVDVECPHGFGYVVELRGHQV